MMPSQFVLINNETKQEFSIEGTVNIGRSVDNDIVIDDASVSRFHSRLDYSGDRLVLKDLDSTNGTCVNGEKIKQIEIAKQSQLQFGDVKFSIQTGEKSLIYDKEKPPPKAEVKVKTKEKVRSKVAMQSILAQEYFHRQLKECVWAPLNDGGEEYIFPVNTISTIGRLDLSDVFIDNKLISRNHAMIELRAHEVVLTDTNSANGTFVNDERIEKKVLTDGDIVGIAGELTFEVSIQSDETQGLNTLRTGPDCSFVDVVQDTNLLLAIFRSEFGEQILLEVERQTVLFYTEFGNYIKLKRHNELYLDEIKQFITLISKAATINEPSKVTGDLRKVVDYLTATKEHYDVTFFEVPDSKDDTIVESNGLFVNFPNGTQLVISDIPYENFFYIVFAASWLSQLSFSL